MSQEVQDMIQKETSQDDELQQLLDTVLDGWPNNKADLIPEITGKFTGISLMNFHVLMVFFTSHTQTDSPKVNAEWNIRKTTHWSPSNSED